MKYVLALALVCLASCGGSGGDGTPVADTVAAQNAPVVAPPTYQCAHDGAVYACNDQETCKKEETTTLAGETTTPTGRTIFYAKSITVGNVTIIAECGSNVNFDLSETTNPIAQVTATPEI